VLLPLRLRLRDDHLVCTERIGFVLPKNKSSVTPLAERQGGAAAGARRDSGARWVGLVRREGGDEGGWEEGVK